MFYEFFALAFRVPYFCLLLTVFVSSFRGAPRLDLGPFLACSFLCALQATVS